MTKPRKILQDIAVYAHSQEDDSRGFVRNSWSIIRAFELALKHVHGQFYLGGYQKLSISIHDTKPHADAEHVWSVDRDVLLVEIWPFDFRVYNRLDATRKKQKQILDLVHQGCCMACEHLGIDPAPIHQAAEHVRHTKFRCFRYSSKPLFNASRTMSCRIRTEYSLYVIREFLEVVDSSGNIIKDVCCYLTPLLGVTVGEYADHAIPQSASNPQWVNNGTSVRLTCEEDDPENPYYIEIPITDDTAKTG